MPCLVQTDCIAHRPSLWRTAPNRARVGSLQEPAHTTPTANAKCLPIHRRRPPGFFPPGPRPAYPRLTLDLYAIAPPDRRRPAWATWPPLRRLAPTSASPDQNGEHRLPAIYDHLHVKDWPFSVVPRPDLCTYLAGRPQLDADIKELLRHLSRRDTSSIRVFWSWFGAGKTHSLHYLLNHAKAQNLQSPPVRCFPVYTEFPRSVRSFVDLYKAFANSMDLSFIGDAFLGHCQNKPAPA